MRFGNKIRKGGFYQVAHIVEEVAAFGLRFYQFTLVINGRIDAIFNGFGTILRDLYIGILQYRVAKYPTIGMT